jgi:hypothetical protein
MIFARKFYLKKENLILEKGNFNSDLWKHRRRPRSRSLRNILRRVDVDVLDLNLSSVHDRLIRE